MKVTDCFLDIATESVMFRTLAGKAIRLSHAFHHQPTKIMGDKSPKANQKKSSQKQAKTSNASQAKQQSQAAKQAAPKK